MFEFARRIVHKAKNAYYTDRNKRRKVIIIKDTLYVYIAYSIAILATLVARSIDLTGMSSRILSYIFLWVTAFTAGFIVIVLLKQTISARYAKAHYTGQFVIWLFTYSFWIYHLDSIRYAGLLFALMAMMFLLPNSNLFESYLLAASITVVQVAVSCYALLYAHQPGSLVTELFYTLCFFPAALFISFLAGQYGRQREKARQAQLEAKTARDVIWKVVRKTADTGGNTLYDALYLVSLIFEYCGAEGGCLFALDPMEQRLDLVFSKLEQNSRDISAHIASATAAMDMKQSGFYRNGAFVQEDNGPAMHEDALFCITFTPDHGFSGVCCLMKAHMIGAVSEEKMIIIRNMLSRAVEVLSKSSLHDEPSNPGTDDKTVLTASSVEKIEKAITYIRDNYTSDISRDGLASHLDISPNYFGKLFAEYTGSKMNDYIVELRINEATRLLRETGKQVIDIAYSVGFNNLRTFNRAFNKNIGMTPQKYRTSGQQ